MITDGEATVDIDKIDVPSRLREVRAEDVQRLADSIQDFGQLQPIVVYRTPNRDGGRHPYTLIAGAHRLAALKSLDRDTVRATIVRLEGVNIRLLEIAENAIRKPLSALDLAEHVAEFRSIWEASHGAIQRGGRRDRLVKRYGSEPVNKAQAEAHGQKFLQAAERLFGRKASSLHNDQKIARIVPELREALRGHEVADNGAKLRSLARLPVEDQLVVASEFVQLPDLEKALMKGSRRKIIAKTMSWPEKRRSAVLSNFADLSKRDQRLVIDHLLGDAGVREQIRAALEAYDAASSA